MPRTPRRGRIIGVMALCCTSSLVACKEGNPIGEGVGPATAVFTPAPPDVTSRYVSLREATVSGGRITLDIVVTEVDEPVTGIAIKLGYPDGFAKFIRCTDGDLFAVPAKCYSAEPGPGEVFVARSITAPGQATTVVGSKVIARVEFLVFGVDTGPIVFEGQNLGGGDASALLDVNGDPILVKWFAGDLEGK